MIDSDEVRSGGVARSDLIDEIKYCKEVTLLNLLHLKIPHNGHHFQGYGVIHVPYGHFNEATYEPFNEAIEGSCVRVRL